MRLYQVLGGAISDHSLIFLLFPPVFSSKSAGISDYRGKRYNPDSSSSSGPFKVSPSHLAIAKLIESQIVSFVISTNVDGMLLKSGLPSEKLAELHGNAFIENCSFCHRRYVREFNTRIRGRGKSRSSGIQFADRFCEDAECGGMLKDSVVHFGEDLNEEVWENAVQECKQADLCVVLGSSLRCNPSHTLPFLNADCKVIICNICRTPSDRKAFMCLRADVGDVMIDLMHRLGLSADGNAAIQASANHESNYRNVMQEEGRGVRSLRLLKRQKADNSIPLGFGRGARQFDLHALKGDKEVIIDTGILPKVICISDCEDSSFVIKSRTTKLLMIGCKNCHITLESIIITGLFEIVHCEAVEVHVNHNVPTISVDLSRDISLIMKYRISWEKVYSSFVENLSINPGECEGMSGRLIDFSQERLIDLGDPTRLQFVTRLKESLVSSLGSDLLTEQVVRERNGHATTQREKDINKGRKERDDLRMETFVREMIKGF